MQLRETCIRLSPEMLRDLRVTASLETIRTGKLTTASTIIRMAVERFLAAQAGERHPG